ncbi:MAG: DUF4249 domain-containing protein, partial [Alistipes sp.]|nr:DUF4249 domain-containing protein [Alistipes sp.]
IEGEEGTRFEAHEENPGEYTAYDVALNDEVSYRLRISSGGEEYESDYRLPQSTPPIEEISFELKDEGGPFQVRFSVRGEADQSRHYLWSYEETWEIHSNQVASHYFGVPFDPVPTVPTLPDRTYSFGDYIDSISDNDPDNNLQPLAFMTPPPYHYCWQYNKSKEILLADTEFVTENVLKDHVLYDIGLSDSRISYLYHTKVYLYSIGEDAYYYYTNQKKNTDETGSVFSPIPSEMQGNIVCTTSPEEPVIGFVEVSRRVEKETFLDPQESPYVTPYNYCEIAYNIERINELGMWPYDFFLVTYDQTFNITLMSQRRCVDCRQMGGVKVRPDWWPNDHY